MSDIQQIHILDLADCMQRFNELLPLGWFWWEFEIVEGFLPACAQRFNNLFSKTQHQGGSQSSWEGLEIRRPKDSVEGRGHFRPE